MRKSDFKTLFIIISLFSSSICISCGSKEKKNVIVSTETASFRSTETEGETVLKTEPQEDLPPGQGLHIKVKDVGPFSEVFNDSNQYQLKAAQRLGIEPLTNLSSYYFISKPLVKIEDCEFYKIENLKYSMPYLVPGAAELLKEIGRNFNDSLKKRGGYPHRIIVTSVLRTPEHVGNLKKVNVNATDSSTHQFATTFDLSYTHFEPADTTRLVNEGDMKNLLAEVLLNLKKEGKCLVKFEKKTSCFHVTTLM